MFSLNEAAKEQLNAHFTGKDPEPIRIYLASGCGGARLGLALDEKKDNDRIFETDGYTFLIDEALLEQAQPLTVTFNAQTGFIIESAMKFPENAGGCSSCGCGGSCS